MCSTLWLQQSRTMKILPATAEDINIVVNWIDSKDACVRWAGPAVTYPIGTALLKKQISFSESNSFVCISEDFSGTAFSETGHSGAGHNGTGHSDRDDYHDQESIIGFGQLLHIDQHNYHLARIIIAPGRQGAGYGRRFCKKLIELAEQRCGRQVSLKVFKSNHAALHVYRGLGFSVVDAQSNSSTFYMVKALPLQNR